MGGQDRPDGRGAESFARKRQYDYAAVRACVVARATMRVHKIHSARSCTACASSGIPC